MSLQFPVRKFYESVALQASAAQTATGNGAETKLPLVTRSITFELDVTAAAAAAGDTLDVYVQTLADQTNWIDIVHFNQVLGNGGAKRYLANISAGQATAMFEVGSALASAGVRHLFGDAYRARWTIASSSAPSFTFSVWGCAG